MVHILHMPPTQKTLGCSCTEDASPTALRKQESWGNEADIRKKQSQGNGVDLIMIKKKKKKKKRGSYCQMTKELHYLIIILIGLYKKNIYVYVFIYIEYKGVKDASY